MIQINAKTRRWGNSIGVVIPDNVVKDQGIKEDEEVIMAITTKKKTTVGDIFKMVEKHPLPKRKDKRTTQEILDEIDRDLEPEMFK